MKTQYFALGRDIFDYVESLDLSNPTPPTFDRCDAHIVEIKPIHSAHDVMEIGNGWDYWNLIPKEKYNYLLQYFDHSVIGKDATPQPEHGDFRVFFETLSHRLHFCTITEKMYEYIDPASKKPLFDQTSNKVKELKGFTAQTESQIEQGSIDEVLRITDPVFIVIGEDYAVMRGDYISDFLPFFIRYAEEVKQPLIVTKP